MRRIWANMVLAILEARLSNWTGLYPFARQLAALGRYLLWGSHYG